MQIRACGGQIIDGATVMSIGGGKLILIDFVEPVTIQGLEIYDMSVTFGEYMSVCGWMGDDDLDLYWALGKLWGTEYYPTHKTVEKLLCNPQAAEQFVIDFGIKVGATECDNFTVLSTLLNLRKSSYLKPFQSEDIDTI